MRKILNSIFQSKESKAQFLFAGIGFLIGLLLLLFSTQLFIQINKALQPNEGLSNYLIVSKKVKLGNTFTSKRTSFSRSDIKDMEAQAFIEKVGVFKSNQFAVWTYGNEVIPVKTELFFEAVPTAFLGEVPEEWSWKEGDEVVPIILAQDFLSLYNFGYALSKGLPQISKSTVMMAPAFDSRVYGPKGEARIKLKIAGFSDRIPSMIVPESFMDWANKNFGGEKDLAPGRLIAKVSDPTNPDLLKYVEDNDLQVNKDQLQASKAGGIIKSIMSIIGVVGVFFILLSLVIFAMNFRVVLAEAKEEIRLLLQLGYTTKILFNYITRSFLIFMGVIVIVVSVLLMTGVRLLQDLLSISGQEFGASVEPLVWLVGIAFVAINLLINLMAVKRLLYRYV